MHKYKIIICMFILFTLFSFTSNLFAFTLVLPNCPGGTIEFVDNLDDILNISNLNDENKNRIRNIFSDRIKNDTKFVFTKNYGLNGEISYILEIIDVDYNIDMYMVSDPTGGYCSLSFHNSNNHDNRCLELELNDNNEELVFSDYNCTGGGDRIISTYFPTLSLVPYVYTNMQVRDILDNNKIVYDGSKDNNIVNNSSRIKITYTYNEDYTSCHVDAILEGGNFTDRLIYGNNPALPGTKIVPSQGFPRDGIDLDTNQGLFFQALDKDGNILDYNGVSINKIGKLNFNNFVVDIDTTQKSYLYFTPRLLNNGYIYNDIYCKIDNTDGIQINKDGDLGFGSFNNDFKDYFKIDSGQTWKISNMSFSDKTFNIYFQIKNRVTGNVMLTKSYNCTIKLLSDGSINGGVINSGTNDEQNMNSDNDKNISPNINNPFSNINENSSLSDMVNSTKNTFSIFQTAFSILPGFVWGMIGILLVVCIALRILGR